MSISLTNTAVDYVRELTAAQADAIGLRLSLQPAGCSGYSYEFDFAREVGADDIEFEQNGARVIVARDKMALVDGMEIDYVRDGINRSFRFNNPNAAGECGCGESFTV